MQVLAPSSVQVLTPSSVEVLTPSLLQVLAPSLLQVLVGACLGQYALTVLSVSYFSPSLNTPYSVLAQLYDNLPVIVI